MRPLSILLLFLFSAPALFAGEHHVCSVNAAECQKEIREMLTGRLYLGLELVDLKPGIIIKNVLADSPAEREGFAKDDLIIAVNGKSMRDAHPADFKQVINEAKNRTLWIIVQHRGALRKIDAHLEPYSRAQIDKIIAAHLKEYQHPAVTSKK